LANGLQHLEHDRLELKSSSCYFWPHYASVKCCWVKHCILFDGPPFVICHVYGVVVVCHVDRWIFLWARLIGVVALYKVGVYLL